MAGIIDDSMTWKAGCCYMCRLDGFNVLTVLHSKLVLRICDTERQSSYKR